MLQNEPFAGPSSNPVTLIYDTGRRTIFQVFGELSGIACPAACNWAYLTLGMRVNRRQAADLTEVLVIPVPEKRHANRNRFPIPASSSTATCRYPLVMLTLQCPAASRTSASDRLPASA